MTTADNRRVILIGAGGHAKVVADALCSMELKPIVCLDSNPKLWRRKIEGILIEGNDDRLSGYPPRRFALANGVGAPLDTRPRRKVYEAFIAKGYDFVPIISASAICSPSAKIGKGSQILTRAIVHPGARIGANAIINTAAIVEHDCTIGDHAHVCPGAILCGGVTVGVGAFVGAGAVVLPYVHVGSGAVVGAGVVVRKDIPDGGRALPARGGARRRNAASGRRGAAA